VATVTIRPYAPGDEVGWLQCRGLSVFGSALYDHDLNEKERYGSPAIELVADADGEIVGMIDVECDTEAAIVCFERPGLGGMIWHLAVHPEHQRRGLAAALLAEAERLAKERGIVRFEAWARTDDANLRSWYESLGFREVDSYLHVYIERDEGLRDLAVEGAELTLVRAFAHYKGDRRDDIRKRFRRVRDSILLERSLS